MLSLLSIPGIPTNIARKDAWHACLLIKEVLSNQLNNSRAVVGVNK